MSDTVQVRGSDFPAYRIAGAIMSVLLLIALVWQVVELFSGDKMTVPEVRWGAAVYQGEATGPDPTESGTLASDVLIARTKLQNERFVTGPAPNEEVPDIALGEDDFLVEEPYDGDRLLTESWAIADEAAAMLRPSERVFGISSLPYAGAALFERPAARDWRWGMADFVTHLGALAILGFALLLSLVLAIRGRVPIVHGKSGRTVKRFGFLERANHWLTSLSFIGLALTGLVIAFGDTIIRPIGEEPLGSLGWFATWGHALFVPSFTIGLLLMIVMWIHRNIPDRYDLHWLKKGGGFFSDEADHPSARKFNAGQKLIFWSAVLGGLIMIGSGIILMFPFMILDIGGTAWAMLVHAVVAALLIAVFLGHIYIGSVGMQGAFWAMWNGNVDRNWAREHHDKWLEEIESGRQEQTT